MGAGPVGFALRVSTAVWAEEGGRGPARSSSVRQVAMLAPNDWPWGLSVSAFCVFTLLHAFLARHTGVPLGCSIAMRREGN